MAGLAKSCNAIGGKIRVTCPRCNKTKYAEVATGTRRKIVRCSCGMSASYSVNYRKAVREAASGRAQVVFNNSKESKIRLCDTSKKAKSACVTLPMPVLDSSSLPNWHFHYPVARKSASNANPVPGLWHKGNSVSETLPETGSEGSTPD